jgi:hypothetical protein
MMDHRAFRHLLEGEACGPTELVGRRVSFSATIAQFIEGKVMQMLAKFHLGQLAATPGALEAMEASGQEPGFFLARHVVGDWGEVNEEDQLLNNEALVNGDRLLSAYRTLKGVKLWVIAEATDDEGQRAATTLLLPSEY